RGVAEAVRIAAAGGVEEQARGFDGVTGDHDIAGSLEAPAPVAVVAHASNPSGCVMLDLAGHREVADLRTRRKRARQPGDEHALLGVGGATYDTHAAIDAGMGKTTGSRQRRERSGRPVDSECFGALGKGEGGGVELVSTVRVPGTLRPPGIADGAGNLQGVLDFVVVLPHLAPVERPVGAIAEEAAGLEP